MLIIMEWDGLVRVCMDGDDDVDGDVLVVWFVCYEAG